ncbi:NupC/NupG family nucleoside CNT transporter [Chitinophagales bacterium]|nr:NupC/NupG family nucleoside CNT transporter [Chitinophagales bacterium]
MEVLADVFRGLLGIAFLLGVCYALSANRKAINWQLVATGLGLQVFLGIIVLFAPGVSQALDAVGRFFVQILAFTDKGVEFIFGTWPAMPAFQDPDGKTVSLGFQFWIKILPTILFFAALTNVLYYFKILPKIVKAFAWFMSKTMKLSGAESLAAAANVFIGQTEAPLVVRPYLEKMSKSELLTLMTGGMATIAGGVLAGAIGILGGESLAMKEAFAKHLITASIMSAPAAIVAAKMLYPETRKDINQSLDMADVDVGSNLLDSISSGTSEGLKLAMNVGAMIIVFLAFIAMADFFLVDVIGYYTGLNGLITDATNGMYSGPSLGFIFGTIMAPIAWLLGVPSADLFSVGQLLGEKTVINEFVAYLHLGQMTSSDVLTDPKSIVIATYALCGFSNFSSIGIQLGGIGAIAPGQRGNLAKFGIKALIGGTVACFITAAIIGIIASIAPGVVIDLIP